MAVSRAHITSEMAKVSVFILTDFWSDNNAERQQQFPRPLSRDLRLTLWSQEDNRQGS